MNLTNDTITVSNITFPAAIASYSIIRGRGLSRFHFPLLTRGFVYAKVSVRFAAWAGVSQSRFTAWRALLKSTRIPSKCCLSDNNSPQRKQRQRCTVKFLFVNRPKFLTSPSQQ